MAPTLTYKDLSRHDIADLTSILNRSPHLPTLANDARIRQQIRDLPPHLKSRISCIAPGCPLHKRLNALPLDDLAATFRREIGVFVSQTWFPLRDAGKLSAEQVYALGMLDAIAGLSITGCAACWLEALASHVEGSIALGAVIIGRVDPGIYDKSKRVLWIEEGVRVYAGEAGVKRMWELGMLFREARKEGAGVGEGREFVGEFVRRAREMGRQSGESSRSAQLAGSSHGRGTGVEVNDWVDRPPIGEEARTRADSPAPHDRRFLSPPLTKVPLRTRPPTTQPPRPPEPPHFHPPEESQPRMASSIYSHHPSTPRSPRPGSSHASWWNCGSSRRSSRASSTGTQIIDLYRHSEFPKNVGLDVSPGIPSPVYGDGVYYRPPAPRPSTGQAGGAAASRPQQINVRVGRSQSTVYERRMASRGIGIVIGGRPRVNTEGLEDVR